MRIHPDATTPTIEMIYRFQFCFFVFCWRWTGLFLLVGKTWVTSQVSEVCVMVLALACGFSQGLVAWVQGRRADWRAARPCVWPASAGWGWRSLHPALWGLATGEAEEHTAGRQVGNPGIKFTTWVNADKLWDFVEFSKTVYKIPLYNHQRQKNTHTLFCTTSEDLCSH